ncbi:MAG: cyclase family protein [bacterium]
MFYDLTMPLFPGQMVWPGDPAVEITPLSATCAGEPTNISVLKVGTHSGTHIDAPRHVLAEEEAAGVDRILPEKLIGPAQVLDLTSSCPESLIRPEAIQAAGFCPHIPRVLFKTGNSYRYNDQNISGNQKFHQDYVSLAMESAEWLTQKGVVLIGIDCLSIESFDTKDYCLHRFLLSHGVVVVEGIVLKSVPPGIYELFCAPLKIVKGDGAPARVFLRTL